MLKRSKTSKNIIKKRRYSIKALYQFKNVRSAPKNRFDMLKSNKKRRFVRLSSVRFYL